MAAKTPALSLLLAFLPILLLSSGASAAASVDHHIVELLSEYSEYSTFASMINQSKIPARVQVHHSITVLALDDFAASGLSGLNSTTLEDVLSVHIILDYFDEKKIHGFGKRSTVVTTLYQSSGRANDQMGFLNITKLIDKEVAFGSAMPNSPLVARLKGAVTAKPYTISVLQIDGPIIPPGIDGTNIVQNPLQNIQVAPLPEAEAPGPSGDDSDDSSDAAAAPDADASDDEENSGSPAPSPADGVVADEVDKPKSEKKSAQASSAGRVVVSAGLGLGMGAILSLVF